MPQAPKPDPVRGMRGRTSVLLPAKGREGPPPPWPLTGVPTSDERAAWVQLWATPQAHAWERLGWTRTVARYCRVMLTAEAQDASAAILAQATVLEDRLGLTPKAMRLLMWQVAPDEVAAKRTAPRSARGRIKAVG